MGIPGLTRWLEGHHRTTLTKAQMPGVNILALDMNGICHAAYDAKKSTERETTAAILASLSELLSKFTPSIGVAILFDGPAPMAKLAEQRKRRQSNGQPQTSKGGSSSGFTSNALTTGSDYMITLEKAVVQFFRDHWAQKESGRHLFISGSTVAGEGETKMMQYWYRLAESPLYRPDLRIVAVTSDSDVAVNAIACTPFDDFVVVNPYTLLATSIRDILMLWTRGGSREWAFTDDQLPSARLDFAMIMSLSGGDHYPGIGSDVFDLWLKYKKKRHTNHQLEPLMMRDGCVRLDLLKALVVDDRGSQHQHHRSHHKGSSKHKKPSTAPTGPGRELIKGAMWAMCTLRYGECADYHFSFKGDAPKMSNLKSFLHAAGRATQFEFKVTTPLPPLQVYVAVVPFPAQLPNVVRQYFAENEVLSQKLHKATSSRHLADLVETIFRGIPDVQFSLEEKSRLKFSEPTCWPSDMSEWALPGERRLPEVYQTTKKVATERSEVTEGEPVEPSTEAFGADESGEEAGIPTAVAKCNMQ